MPLTGPFGILFWVAVVQLAIGNWLVFTMLSKHGGLDRTKTLFVVFDPDSPMKADAAKSDRWRFRIGVYMVGFGLMTFYTALSTGDQRELQICQTACRREGYGGGQFAPSQKQAPGAQPQRACWCIGPAGSIELEQTPPSPLMSAPNR